MYHLTTIRVQVDSLSWERQLGCNALLHNKAIMSDLMVRVPFTPTSRSGLPSGGSLMCIRLVTNPRSKLVTYSVHLQQRMAATQFPDCLKVN
eukprot:jgi/Botrbrau1/16720/Bobra.0270s0005.1